MHLEINPIMQIIYQDKIMSCPGIYSIVNKHNNRHYIGSTKQLMERYRDGHLCPLRKGEHHNIHLQRAFYKYGEEAFIFQVLEVCSVDKLIEREQAWFELTGCCDRKIGYNIVPRADRKACSEETKAKISAKLKGRRIPKETCQKMSESRMGHKVSLETRQRISTSNSGKEYQAKQRKPILQFTADGNFIKEYPSMLSVKKSGYSTAGVWRACNGFIKEHKGSIWKYK